MCSSFIFFNPGTATAFFPPIKNAVIGRLSAYGIALALRIFILGRVRWLFSFLSRFRQWRNRLKNRNHFFGEFCIVDVQHIYQLKISCELKYSLFYPYPQSVGHSACFRDPAYLAVAWHCRRQENKYRPVLINTYSLLLPRRYGRVRSL